MPAPPDLPEEITPAEARVRHAAGAVLVDVREPGEWALGTPLGALRVPLARLVEGLVAQGVDRGTPVLAICGGGARSLRAAEALHGHGYERVASVHGGFTRWKREGLPFEVVSALDADARDRYSRHLLLPEVGEAGQQRLARARVLVVGAGGLGSPAAYYLAAAGVGRLRIVDHDRVERSNLQRQILHSDARVGDAKVASASATLAALNPRIAIEAIEARLDDANADALVAGCDVVLDGSDNFLARYAVNAACVRAGKPLVHGAVHRYEGQVSVFAAPGPCYRCLFPEPPPPEAAPNCAEAGVLGVVPGLVGLMQATEAVKLLLAIGEPLIGRVVHVDALTMRFRELKLPRDPECPGCGPDPRPVLAHAPACAG
ncbi:MAG TPA: molybdopterin-synthase adenylyltransferase MoeB [Candidatus Saccharimonadia bacterium]|nr:molybdopterin-synthase adenylyltransferase MoeB [Candidatus Saccharimonadia bacterium]